MSRSRDIKEAILRVNYDDGFRCYINGIEVARANMPEGYSHTAAAPRSRQSHGFEAFRLQPAVLRDGENVIACEVRNSSAASDDLLLHVELAFLYTEPRRCPPFSSGLDRLRGRDPMSDP